MSAAMTPGVIRTLQTDFTRGVWSPGTLQFFRQTLQDGKPLTPSIVQTAQRDFKKGDWSLATVYFVGSLGRGTPAPVFTQTVADAMEHDFQSGVWSSVTMQFMRQVAA